MFRGILEIVLVCCLYSEGYKLVHDSGETMTNRIRVTGVFVAFIPKRNREGLYDDKK